MNRTVVILLLLSVLCLIGGCSKPAPPPPPTPPAAAVNTPPAAAPAATTGADLGRQIFETGIGSNGLHIAFTAGSDRFQVKPGGCIGCHGPDAHGKQLGNIKSPNITYTALRGGAKPLYATDDAVLVTIRQGKDETGQPLSAMMPHWQVSDAEGKALLEHLKTVDKTKPASATTTPGKS